MRQSGVEGYSFFPNEWQVFDDLSDLLQDAIDDYKDNHDKYFEGDSSDWSDDDSRFYGRKRFKEHELVYRYLVGEQDVDASIHFSEDSQKVAQEGILDLVEAVSGRSRFGTIEECRQEIVTDISSSGLSHLLDLAKTKNDRRKLILMLNDPELHYQNSMSPDEVTEGDYLSFNQGTPGEPDLDNMLRVYVVPKIEYSGHVAAEICRKMKAAGVVPHGKVFDQSTNKTGLTGSTDRLLFFIDQRENLDVAMQAIKEVQSQSPEWFENDPPVMTQRTKIPGVGLAEDPPSAMSFNKLRAKILTAAVISAEETKTESGNADAADKEVMFEAFKNTLQARVWVAKINTQHFAFHLASTMGEPTNTLEACEQYFADNDNSEIPGMSLEDPRMWLHGEPTPAGYQLAVPLFVKPHQQVNQNVGLEPQPNAISFS